MTQQRAPKGGMAGMNGEFYQGGEFLPSTQLPSQHRGSVKTQPKLRKVQIAPYVWEVQPAAGVISIYAQIAGIFGRVASDGRMVINASPTTLVYYGKTLAEVEALVERYNEGERWI